MSPRRDPRPPGDIQLLPGYKHEKLQGYDSAPGTISKPGGLQIHYEIGEVPKPGAPQHGGHFFDRAQAVPRGDLSWYKEQSLNGQPVHLAYTTGAELLVSYPESGVNFSARAKTHEELAEALLMVLTFAPAGVGD